MTLLEVSITNLLWLQCKSRFGSKSTKYTKYCNFVQEYTCLSEGLEQEYIFLQSPERIFPEGPEALQEIYTQVTSGKYTLCPKPSERPSYIPSKTHNICSVFVSKPVFGYGFALFVLVICEDFANADNCVADAGIDHWCSDPMISWVRLLQQTMEFGPSDFSI